MRNLILYTGIFLLAGFLFCKSTEKKESLSTSGSKQEVLKFEGSRLEVMKISVAAETLLVEIAAKPEDRERGFMDRQFLPENTGMLFVFEYTHNLSFWMRNTELPLSIAFIDEGMKIVDIQDMEPWEDESHESKFPAKYALEVNKGWFTKYKIKTGDKVKFITQ